MPISTLKKRDEFLRVRGGRRWSTPAFLIECKARADNITKNPEEARQKADCCSMKHVNRCKTSGARFGFTVTKKVGNAVVRNRMRRRLKALIDELAPELADRASDYVIVARRPAFDRDFSDMKNDMRIAFNRLHRPQNGSLNQSRRRGKSTSETGNRHAKQ